MTTRASTEPTLLLHVCRVRHGSAAKVWIPPVPSVLQPPARVRDGDLMDVAAGYQPLDALNPL